MEGRVTLFLGKKGIIKSLFGLMIVLLLMIIMFSIYFSETYTAKSLLVEKENYELGETIKINLPPRTYDEVKIITPTSSYKVDSSQKVVVFKPSEVGEYEIAFYTNEEKVLSERFNVFFGEVNETNFNSLPVINEIKETEVVIENKTHNIEDKEIELYFKEGITLSEIEINKPVKWKISKTVSASVKVELPSQAQNIHSYKIEGNKKKDIKIEIDENSLENTFSKIVSLNKNSGKIYAKLDENGKYELEFETPGPTLKENNLRENVKEITVSSKTGLHYEDVRAHVEIKELNLDKNNITLFWIEENKFLDFEIIDQDKDGLYDKIEWEIPHLSEQSFEITVHNSSIIPFDYINDNQYILGDSILFNFYRLGDYEFTINEPSGKEFRRIGSNDRLIYELKVEGEYSIIFIRGNERFNYRFFVGNKKQESGQQEAVIGESVEWKKEVNEELIEVAFAENISLKDLQGNEIDFELITKNGTQFIQVIDNFTDNLILEYNTPPATIEESYISEKEKEVVISSPEGIHYENVKAFTKIPEITTDANSLQIYWKNNDTFVDFNASDTDGDGLLDYIEWNVPHTSEQIFQIIFISSAEHLDSSRNLIEDVYPQVSSRDGLFKEIPEGNFIRVMFKENLSSENDITIYAKSNSSGRVEVYEKNSEIKLADFGSITSDGIYKIFLSSLGGEQDTFDLKVVDGNVEFDYIVDPTVIYTYNYVGVSTSSGAHQAYAVDLDAWPPNDGLGTIAGNTNVFTELADGEYTSISTSNNNRFQVPDPGNGDEPMLWMRMRINESEVNVAQIGFLFEGYPAVAGTVGIYLYNDSAGSWDASALASAAYGTSDQTLHATLSNGITNYINGSGDIIWGVFSSVSTEILNVDFVRMNLTYTDDNVPLIAVLSPLSQNYSSVVSFNITLDEIGTWCGLSLDGGSNITMTQNNNTNFGYFNSTMSNGQHTVRFACNDTLGNLNVSSGNLQFGVDTINPRITIIDPINFTIAKTIIYFNFTTNEPSTCSYSLNSGTTNYSMTGNASLTGFNASNISIADGSYIVRAYCNDSVGNNNFTVTRTFTKDTTVPQVNITSPLNITYSSSTIYFNLTTNEASSCYYSLDSGLFNYSMIANLSNTGFGSSNASIADGSYIVRAYCNDSVGNNNFTTTRTFSKDTTSPSMIINYPLNGSTIRDVTPVLNVSLIENVSRLWYSINGGVTNTTICNNCIGNQVKPLHLAEGFYLVRVYANDSFGFIGTNNSNFSINMNNNYYDTFEDNSSIQSYSLGVHQTNRNVTFVSSEVATFYNGIELGYVSGNLQFTANQFNGGANAGEIDITCPGGDSSCYFISKNGTNHTGFTINSGVALTDALTVQGFIMFSHESVHTRFSASPPNAANANNFIGVCYTGGQWFWDDNNDCSNGPFTPRSNDILVANVTWGVSNIQNLNGSLGYGTGNFTAYSINTTGTISRIVNITWSDYNVDQNNNISVDVSANAGTNWYRAIKSETLAVTPGNSLIYRVLFSTNQTFNSNLSLTDINISWSDTQIPPPSITINYPLNSSTVKDVTPTINVTLSSEANTLWYTTNNGIRNYTLCTSCSGEKTFFVHLAEGSHTLRLYANDTFFLNSTNSSSFFIDMDFSEFESYNDNSSIQSHGDLNLNLGNVSSKFGTVLSVQTLEINLSNSTSRASNVFTKNQNYSNVVPFVTFYNPNSGVAEDWENHLTNVFINSSSVVVNRSSTIGDMIYYISLVEFNPEKVRVQTGNMCGPTLAGCNITLPISVNRSRAALIFYPQINGVIDDDVDRAAILGNITQDNQIRFQRVDSGVGIVSGTWYVFESLDDSFSVQNRHISLNTLASANATINSVNMNKSFLIASLYANTATDDAADYSTRIYLSNDTTITSIKGTAADNVQINVYVITFSRDIFVQRGTLSYSSGALTASNSSLIPINTEMSVPWTPLIMSKSQSDSNAEGALQGSLVGLVLTDSSTLVGTRGLSVGGVLTSYEVIDFSLTARIFTSYSINTTQTITQIIGINWSEDGTDDQNSIGVEVSLNNGQNFYSATKGQSLSGIPEGNVLIYRFIFNTNNSKIISLNDFTLNWSNATVPPPAISLFSPSDGTIKDVTPYLNVSVGNIVSRFWYNLNNGENITLCTDCTGTQFRLLHLPEGSYTLRVYANDSANRIGTNLSSFEINMSNSFYDSFEDNSSIKNYEGTIWREGNISSTYGSVISVENLGLSLGVGITSNSMSFSKSQNYSNVIPLVTMSHGTTGDPEDWQQHLTSVSINSTSIILNRASSTAALMFNLSLVEFNPEKVRVQSGTICNAAITGCTTTIPTVVNRSRTALVFYPQISGVIDDDANMASVLGNISSDNVITFYRQGVTGTVSGTWYVFESLDDSFSVQSRQISLNTLSTANATINTVNISKTFLIASSSTSIATDDAMSYSSRVQILNSSTIQATKGDATGNTQINVYAITFSRDLFVQRGNLNFSVGATSSYNFTLMPVNMLMSTAWNPSLVGRMQTNSNAADAIQSAFVRLDLRNSTSIFGSRGLSVGSTIASYEILDFSPGTQKFTILSINTTASVKQITNVTWNENNVDANNSIGIEISANNGLNWTEAQRGQRLNGFPTGNEFLIRMLFNINGSKIITLNDLTVNWSDFEFPTIFITYPTIANYSANVSSLNYTISGSSLVSCWYTLNGGITNTTVTCGNNVTDLTSYEGNNTWEIYVMNSIGETVSDSITFFKDSLAPILNFSSPPNGTISQNFTQNFTANLTDNFGLQNGTLYIYNSTNSLLNQTTVSLSGTEAVIGIVYQFVYDDIFRWFFGVFDELGNILVTQNSTLAINVNAPIVGGFQCEKSGVWQTCSNISFGETITGIRVNCTDQDIIRNATLNFTNIPDGNTFLFANASSINGVVATYNLTNFYINDSGEFRIDAICFGNGSGNSSSYTNWSVPWGNLSVNLVSPSTDTRVRKGNFFDFIVNVSCLGGECGNVNASLDPPEDGMQLVFNDTFTGTDGTLLTAHAPNLGVNWFEVFSVGSGHLQITGNQLDSTQAGNDGSAHLANISQSWGRDQLVKVLYSVQDGDDDHVYLILRSDTTMSNAYVFSFSTLAVDTYIWRRTGGTTNTVLNSSCGADNQFVTGDTVSFKVTGNLIEVYDGNTLICSAVDSQVTSGRPGVGIGASYIDVSGDTDLQRADNLLIYHREEKYGLVPMNSGIPYYTTSLNPMNHTNNTCLSGLVAGNTCSVSWRVNATGVLNLTSTFFAYVNATYYSSQVSSGITSRINLSISTDTSPTIVITYPQYGNYTTNVSSLNYTVIAQLGTTLDTCWYTLNQTSNTTINCGDNIVGINSQDGDFNWTIYANNTLGELNSETVSFRVDTTGPNITVIFPSNGTVSTVSSANLTVNISDMFGIDNTTLYVYNSTGLLYNETVEASGTEAVIGILYDFVSNGIYTWYYEARDIFGNLGISDINFFTQSAPGDLIITLINPSSNTNVNPGEYFPFTAQVTCINGPCGNVNLTLDPPVNWYNTSWDHRQIINLSGVGSALSDYQINITTNLSDEYSNGKINSTCTDVRFTNSSGSLLSHWEQNCSTNGPISTFWVKVPTINTTGITQIYMYYGNPLAVSVSNGTATFEFFDTGDQNSSWTRAGVVGNTTAQGNPIPSYFANSVNGYYMYRNASLTTNRIIEYDSRSNGLGNLFFMTSSAGSGQHLRLETRGGNNAGIGAATTWTAWSVPSQTCANLATNTWFNFRIIIGATTAQGYINNVACGGAYTFSNNGPYIGLVGDALGAGSTTWWDNLRVRKYSSSVPSFSFGVEESKDKGGIIPMNSGSPFYTITQNPNSYLNTSCLADLGVGESCNVTWIVNATGLEGTVWEFFVYGNSTNYSETSGQSSIINVTIMNLPPLTPELNFPINNSVFSTFTQFNWSNTTDPTRNRIYYTLQISNTTGFTTNAYYNGTITEIQDPTGDTPNGITIDRVYYWRVLATDLKLNSSWSEIRTFTLDTTPPNITLLGPDNNTLNTTTNTQIFSYNVTDLSNVTSCNLIINSGINDSDSFITKGISESFSVFLPNGIYYWSVNCTDQVGLTGSSQLRILNLSVEDNPPSAHEITCEENSNGIYRSCSSIVFADNLTGVRVRCTDPENSMMSATFNLTNVPDNYNYFVNSSTTSSAGNNWSFSVPSQFINDSGNFTLIATCTDSEGLNMSNSTTWLVPWGQIDVDLINPTINTYVQQYLFFNFTVNVSCIGGECGNVNATLDPAANWFDTDWDYRQIINLSGVGSPLSDFQINISTNLTDEYLNGKINVDCSDVRFANSSGNLLNHYEQNCSTNGPISTFWIKVPTINRTGITPIYMYYGNTVATTVSNGSSTFDFFDTGDQNSSWTRAGIVGNTTAQGNPIPSYFANSVNGYYMYRNASLTANRTIEYDSRSNGLGNLFFMTSSAGSGQHLRLETRGGNNAGIGAATTWTAWSVPSQTCANLATNTWFNFRIEISSTTARGYINNAACGGAYTFSNNGPYLGLVGDGLGASSTTWWDNLRVRKYSSSVPSFTLGEEELGRKGIIPMTSGEPFYTTTQNPNSYTSTSCLANMKTGEPCQITWQVNATGNVNTEWEFFVYGNNTNYTSLFYGYNESNRINITIVSQLAPSIPILNSPANDSAFDGAVELNWINSTDVNGDDIFYVLQVSNYTNFSVLEYSNNSIREESSPTGDLPTISADGTYYWRVLATDMIDNSSWSEIRTFYIDNYAPFITLINQTGEDDLEINLSHPLDEGENLTINVNVTDVSISGVWVVIWGSVKGGAILIEKFFDFVEGAWYQVTIPTNSTVGIDVNYTIYANDTLNQTSELDGNFTLLKGKISLNLNPNIINGSTEINAKGHLNLSNGSVLGNHPINLWLDGNLLLLINLTSQGTFDNYLEFNDTDSNQFNYGTYANTQTDGSGISLIDGNAAGNYTRILDASARVEWKNIKWISTGEACNAIVTYQEGDAYSYSSTEDSYIDSGAATTNYGSVDGLLIDGSPTSQRGIISYGNIIGRGLNQIPPNSTIIGANITLTVSDPGNIVSVYEVLENWSESQVTYNDRLTGTAWTSNGIAGSPSRSSTTEDSFTAVSAGTYSINIINAVKRWTNGSSNNFGIVLDMPTSNGINIRSSEYSVQTERPKLTVQYNSTECTQINIYIRTSNDKLTWSSWSQVSSGSSISDSFGASRYLEYKVEMSATNTTLSPTLHEIFVNYTAVVTNSSGDFDYNFTSPTAVGAHYINVTSGLRTININASANLSVQSGQTGLPPNITLISPNNSQWFSDGEITFIYNTSDVNNNLANATLFINGFANLTNTSLVSGEYNNFTLNLSSGIYNWTVNVTDTTNLNSQASPIRIFYVDLENPNITLIYPPNGTNYSVSTLDLSYNVTDNMDTILACDVVFDSVVIESLYPSQNGGITNASTGVLTAGIYEWYVICFDEANRNTTSQLYEFEIIDIPPTILPVWPPISYLDSDGNISFVFNASDSTGFTNATLIINGTYYIWNQSTINNGINTSINVSDLNEGAYNWSVIVYDLSGTTAQTETRTFTVDLYSPTINLTGPYNGSTLTNADVQINFTVVDTIDTTLTCSIAANNYQDNNFAATNGSITNRPFTNFVDGLYYWNVTCIDDALHQNSSINYQFNVSEPPTITLNVPNESSFSTNNIYLNYTPTDNTNLSICNLYIDGIYNQSNSTTLLNGQLNNFSLQGISSGLHSWFVNCSDVIGLTGQSEERVFTIDTFGPQITLHYPDGIEIGTGDITFNFTAIDDIDSSFMCSLTIDTIVEDPNFLVSNGTVVNRTILDIADGLHFWNVTCVDGSSNYGNSTTFNFTISTPPEVVLIYPVDGHWFNYSNLNLTYFPTDDEGFRNSYLYLNEVINQTNSTTINSLQNNNFSLFDVQDGIYNWTVAVEDVRGLNTTATPSRIFYVDTHSPHLNLNYPYNELSLITNNITFNFTVTDNLDSPIECNLYLDGEIDYSDNSTNGTDVLDYILVNDGIHFWNVTCYDEADNINISQIYNFSVEAPPNVTLVSPSNLIYTNLTSMLFVYLPEDPLGFENCSLFIDGQINSTSNTIIENQNNNFTVTNITEGYHNWTVECYDAAPDYNPFSPTPWNFTMDRTAPNISLFVPINNTNQLRNVTFNFSANDLLDLDLNLTCRLNIDNSVNLSNLILLNGSSYQNSISPFALGPHSWNVSCFDDAYNLGYSELRIFNVTLPDLLINTSLIVFNVSSVAENDSVLINATIYNLGNVSVNNIIVQFMDGPIGTSRSYQIGNNITINSLAGLSSTTINVTWNTDIGTSTIFVYVDIPTLTNGSIEEWNETNNYANTSITVGSWQFVYGDLNSNSFFELATNLNSSLIRWENINTSNGNLFVTDYESVITWTSLKSIGRNRTNSVVLDDFAQVDELLNMTNFSDSISTLYATIGGAALKTDNYTVFNFNTVLNVPNSNSTNNTNFQTGIFWDSSDDSNGQFDTTNKEDLVFGSKLNMDKVGAYGRYDYEMRIPAKLREYRGNDHNQVVFYAEIT